MNYMNATTKTEAQIEALLAADDGGPICMVNLLKFRDKAEYEDGRESAIFLVSKRIKSMALRPDH